MISYWQCAVIFVCKQVVKGGGRFASTIGDCELPKCTFGG